MLRNGQDLYKALENMTEEERRSKYYDLYVERNTLRNIVEVSVSSDIKSDWVLENDGPAMDSEKVMEAFDKLPDSTVDHVINAAWNTVTDGWRRDSEWDFFTEVLGRNIRDVLMDSLRKGGKR